MLVVNYKRSRIWDNLVGLVLFEISSEFYHTLNV